MDPNGGTIIAYLGDGFGGFSETQKVMNSHSQADTLSSYDFNNDGAIDLLLGGHEFNRKGRKMMTSRVYLNNGSGGFSQSNSIPIPSVKEYGNVLDFLVNKGFMFVVRTNQLYRGGAIQTIDLSTMEQIGLDVRADVPHPTRLRRVRTRDGKATFSNLSSSRTHFDFYVGADNKVHFLN